MNKCDCESKIPIDESDDAFSLYSKTIHNVKKLFTTFVDQRLFNSLNKENKTKKSGIFYSKILLKR